MSPPHDQWSWFGVWAWLLSVSGAPERATAEVPSRQLGPSAVASRTEDGGQVVAVDEVLCMHCKHEIGPDRDGFWVHLDGGFKCQVANVRLSTFAEPPGPPNWPLNSADIRNLGRLYPPEGV